MSISPDGTIWKKNWASELKDVEFKNWAIKLLCIPDEQKNFTIPTNFIPDEQKLFPSRLILFRMNNKFWLNPGKRSLDPKCAPWSANNVNFYWATSILVQ